MPIYEYQCKKCGNHVEVIQKFSDSPLKTCPSCKGRLHKLISQTSFQLKGSGWYVTDYAGKSASKTDGKGESAKTESKAGEKGSSETSTPKPAAVESGKSKD